MRGIGSSLGEHKSRGDAVIELTKFVFETLRQGGEFALRRGRRDDGKLPTILVVAPVSEYPRKAVSAKVRI